MNSYNKRGGADAGQMGHRKHAGMSSSSDESPRGTGTRRRQEEQSNRMMSGAKGNEHNQSNPMLDYALRDRVTGG